MADLPAEGVDIDAELLRFEQLVDKSDPEQMVDKSNPERMVCGWPPSRGVLKLGGANQACSGGGGKLYGGAEEGGDLISHPAE